MNKEIAKYGKLSVVKEESKLVSGRRRTFVTVLCDCGNIKSVRKDWLVSKGTSCGCDTKERFLSSILARIDDLELITNKLEYAYKQAASNRNIEYVLPKDIFVELIFLPCVYCGELPSNEISRSGSFSDRSLLVNGIDRIDNSIGYVLENVVPCYGLCNRIKSDRQKEEFLDHMRKIRLNAGSPSYRLVLTNKRKFEEQFYRRYERGATKRGLDFCISLDQFLDISYRDCYYCGSKPDLYIIDYRTKEGLITNGVDRYENDLGYTPSNLVPCCKICNTKKLQLDGDEFINKAIQVSIAQNLQIGEIND